MTDKKKTEGPKCTGKRADGRPCQQNVIRGTTRCWHHSFKVPGRPSKLTAELQERVLDAVLEGAFIEVACQACGISKRTFYRWLKRGEEAEARAMEQFDSDDEPDLEDLYEHVAPEEWPYLDFCHAVQSAEAFSELELLRKVTRGGEQPWTAYMTVLERRHPTRWQRRQTIEHDGAVDLGRPQFVTPDPDAAKAMAIALQEAGVFDSGDNPTEGDPE